MTTVDPDTLQVDPNVLRDIVRRFDGRLALNADVVRPGTIRIGDAVRLVQGARAVKPSRVFFAVDGPRREKTEDAQRVTDVRKLASIVDWPCDLQTLFQAQNLGCKHAVSQAITWFFQQVEEVLLIGGQGLPIELLPDARLAGSARFGIDDEGMRDHLRSNVESRGDQFAAHRQPALLLLGTEHW